MGVEGEKAEVETSFHLEPERKSFARFLALRPAERGLQEIKGCFDLIYRRMKSGVNTPEWG